MDYESVEQAAKRLQVTPRSVQKWAKEGKIPEVRQVGRTWLIPVGFAGPGVLDTAERSAGGRDAERELSAGPVVYSLHDGNFEPGHCLEYIHSLPEGAQRDVVMAQYYHFTGQTALASKTAEPYLDHDNRLLALSASMVYCFANMGLGKIHLYQIGRDYINKHVTLGLRVSENTEERAYAILVVTMAHILLHTPCPPMPPLESVVKDLPKGLKLYAAYLMAYEAYLKKDYERSLGITELALAFCGDKYVLPQIYLYLMSCIDLMNLRRIVEAKAHFEKAWELAQPDDMIEIFGEHMGLMQGMLEVSLKKRSPQDYERVVRLAASYGDSWSKIHNARTNRTVTMELTATELAVATLFQRGWAVKEIAAYMEISPRMVRHHISVIYEKLGITHREELAQYMLL